MIRVRYELSTSQFEIEELHHSPPPIDVLINPKKTYPLYDGEVVQYMCVPEYP